MKHIAEKFVARLLNCYQKGHHCVAVCTELKISIRYDPNLISNVITNDKSQVDIYNPDKKKTRQVHNNVKSMSIVLSFTSKALSIRNLPPSNFQGFNCKC